VEDRRRWSHLAAGVGQIPDRWIDRRDRGRSVGPDGKAAALARQADSLKAKLGAVQEAIHQVRNKAPEDPLNFPIRVNNKLAALGGAVGSADAAPTAPSYQVFDLLSGELQGYLDRLRTILDNDVPAFNRAVREQDIPALIVR